jgi:hypothetical protein
MSETPIKGYRLLEYCLSSKYPIPHGSVKCKLILLYTEFAQLQDVNILSVQK